MMNAFCRAALAVALTALPGGVLFAQDSLLAEVREHIDRAVTEVLGSSGAPSASIAVVRNGTLAYAKAYGNARLEPPTPATPVTLWHYASTNYVFGGVSVEKVAGPPLREFLTERVFRPLGMSSVLDTDLAGLGPTEPERYRRFALGPPRPAPKEGRGWMFAAG